MLTGGAATVAGRRFRLDRLELVRHLVSVNAVVRLGSALSGINAEGFTSFRPSHCSGAPEAEETGSSDQ